MARYRKTETCLWIDERFRELSAPQPNAQTLWFYLLTGQRTTTFPGLVVAREAVMADDLGWPIEAFREAFLEIAGKGMADADWRVGVVVLKKALLDSHGDPRETAKPESPNVLRSWAKSWDEIPDCSMKTSYLRQLGYFAEALGEGYLEAYQEAFRKALVKASPRPSPNQEQEQEQEQEEERVSSKLDDPPPVLALVPPEPKRDPVAEAATPVIAELNRLTGRRFQPESETVARDVKALLKAKHTVDEMLAVVRDKVSEWRDDDKMRKHLVPTTLLRPSNFKRYLEDIRARPSRASPARAEPPESQRWFPDRTDEEVA